MSTTNEKVAKAKDAAAKAQDAAAKARVKADEGVQKLGGLTHQHRDQIDAKVDQAAKFVNDKVGAQHAGKVAKVKEFVQKGLDKLAAQRPAARAAHDDQASDYQV